MNWIKYFTDILPPPKIGIAGAAGIDTMSLVIFGVVVVALLVGLWKYGEEDELEDRANY